MLFDANSLLIIGCDYRARIGRNKRPPLHSFPLHSFNRLFVHCFGTDSNGALVLFFNNYVFSAVIVAWSIAIPRTGYRFLTSSFLQA